MLPGFSNGTIAGAALLLAGALAPGMALAFDQNSVDGASVKATPFEALVLGTRKYRDGDMDAAITALEMAADGGEPLAQWKLGRIYADGDGVESNPQKAFEIFQRLANDHAEDPPRGRYSRAISNAFVTLGKYYQAGIPGAVRPDPYQAIRLYRHAAMYFADSEAQYRLARAYLEDDKVAPKPRQAARWLKLAAEKNHVEAQALLGQLMWAGDVIARRPVTGLGWLLIARDGATPLENQWIEPLIDNAMTRASDLTRQRALERLDKWRKSRGPIGNPVAAANG